MDNNVGKRLKSVALLFVIIMWSVIIFLTIIEIKHFGLIVLPCSIGALFITTIMYSLLDAFGEIVERVCRIEEKLNNTKSQQNREK